MQGMSAATGKPLAGDDHLRQSIARILTTPIGSRVAQREFGSLLPELVDQPMNGAGRLRLFAATAVAIARWEKRVKLVSVTLVGVAGAYALQLTARRTDRRGPAEPSIFTVPLRPNGSLAPYA